VISDRNTAKADYFSDGAEGAAGPGSVADAGTTSGLAEMNGVGVP